MRSRGTVAIAFAAVLWCLGSGGHAAPRPKSSDDTAELKLLDGKWIAVDCVWEGRLRAGRRLVKDKLQLQATGKTWVLSGGPGIEIEKLRYAVTLDRSATPHHVELQWVNDSDKPVELTLLEIPNGGEIAVVRKRISPPSKGIYEYEGKSLKMVFGRAGEPRPTTLESSKLGDGQTLIVLERPKE